MLPSKPLVQQDAAHRGDWIEYRAGGLRWRVRPEWWGEALAGLFAAPEVAFGDPQRVLKTSSRSVVARIPPFAGREIGLILKRYAAFGLREVCRSLVQGPRAEREFRRACAVAAAGFPIAKPVAVGRATAGRWWRRSFLITEEIPQAPTLRRFWDDPATAPAQRRAALCAFARLLAQLYNAGLAHCDLNPSNFLVRAAASAPARCGRIDPAAAKAPGQQLSEGPRLWLIDLDGVRRRSGGSLDAVARDLRRLSYRARVRPFTQLRFLKCFCQACLPPMPFRRLAAAVQRGWRDWEMRLIGRRRWRVRLARLSDVARRVLEAPEEVFAGAATAGEVKGAEWTALVPSEAAGGSAYRLRAFRIALRGRTVGGGLDDLETSARVVAYSRWGRWWPSRVVYVLEESE